MGSPRYTATAIVLHWAIACAIMLMIPFGLWMHEFAERGIVNDGVFRAYQLHKSIGLTVLALSIARLILRFMNPPPPLPESMPAWERIVAAATHWIFYVLIIGMPLTGWLYVSASWSIHDDAPLEVTTRWFGLFAVPHLFGLPNASEAARAATAETAMNTHALMAYGAIALIFLHAGAALKHHLLNKDDVLVRMIPWLHAHGAHPAPAPKNPARLAILGGGLGLVAIASIATVLTWSDMASEAAAQGTTPSGAASLGPAAPRGPNAWAVDQQASTLGYAFVYTSNGIDQRFAGRFSRWNAAITFDPDNLAASHVTATIDMASAADGVPLHDRQLPAPAWFDTASHPTATFQSSEFVRLPNGAYEARGALTIKGVVQPLTLPFTLLINGQNAVMEGSASIDRRAFGVGVGADADTDIGPTVQVTIHIEATRAP